METIYKNGKWYELREVEVTPKPTLEIEIGPIRHRFIRVPPGTFLMGSTKVEEGRYEDEGPQHEVTISRGFWLGETPCTQDLWETVMGNNPSCFRSPLRPVEWVNWYNCQDFLSQLEGYMPDFAARLPTEAEWEYACRAGTTGSRYGELNEIAWYEGNSRGETHEVGLKRPNPWGLYDMLGNVQEWCEDVWDGWEPGRSNRVFRGGSWASFEGRVRAAYRYGTLPGLRYDDLGFRIVLSQVRKDGDRA